MKCLFAAVCAAALLSVAAPVASAAESGCTLSSTNGTVSRSLGGRSYLVNVPAGLSASQVPLLVSLHGAGSTGSQDELFTGWSSFAASHGFIVAYPQARPFDFGGVWDPYTSTSEDYSFLRDVVADISATWCVDPRRVHLDGWSNGAVMSQREACEAADTFASATSYAGGPPDIPGVAKACTPSRPISVGLLAGQFDFTYPALASNASDWRARNGCGAAAVHTVDSYGSTDTYSCAAGTKVFARVVNLTSHNWPSGAMGEDQRNRMWAFFAANPRP